MHDSKEGIEKAVEGMDDIKKGGNEMLQRQLQMLLGLAEGVDRSMAALALLAADQFKVSRISSEIRSV